jgi:hypothetical protein
MTVQIVVLGVVTPCTRVRSNVSEEHVAPTFRVDRRSSEMVSAYNITWCERKPQSEQSLLWRLENLWGISIKVH